MLLLAQLDAVLSVAYGEEDLNSLCAKYVL